MLRGMVDEAAGVPALTSLKVLLAVELFEKHKTEEAFKVACKERKVIEE